MNVSETEILDAINTLNGCASWREGIITAAALRSTTWRRCRASLAIGGSC